MYACLSAKNEELHHSLIKIPLGCACEIPFPLTSAISGLSLSNLVDCIYTCSAFSVTSQLKHRSSCRRLNPWSSGLKLPNQLKNWVRSDQSPFLYCPRISLLFFTSIQEVFLPLVLVCLTSLVMCWGVFLALSSFCFIWRRYQVFQLFFEVPPWFAGREELLQWWRGLIMWYNAVTRPHREEQWTTIHHILTDSMLLQHLD